METDFLIFMASTQLIFAGVCIFGAILGITTVYKYSPEDRDFYYPTWKPAVGFYLLHFMEVLYVAFFFSQESLLLVNMIGLLVPINLALLTWDSYFFFKKTCFWIKAIAFIPLLVIIPQFLYLIHPDMFAPGFEERIMWYTYLILLLNITAFVIYQIYAHRRNLKTYEMEYSNISDFPKDFAFQMCCVLGIWVGLHFIMFMSNSAQVKVYVDLIRISIAIFITIIWMRENRSRKESPMVQAEEEVMNVRDDFGDNHILESLHKVMREQELFLNPELRLLDLQSILGTNRTYLSRAINSVAGQTFYSIVQHYRVEYAKELLINRPEMKLDDIAIESGFSSRSFFSRNFKEEVGISPSEYRRIECINIA